MDACQKYHAGKERVIIIYAIKVQPQIDEDLKDGQRRVMKQRREVDLDSSGRWFSMENITKTFGCM